MVDDLQLAADGTGPLLQRDYWAVICNCRMNHPEAGKITFAAYRNGHGDVIFHIRSRARAASVANLAGFLIGGDPMQSNTWSEFVERVAHSVGDGVIRHINAEKKKERDEELDAEPAAPTLIARGE